MDSSSSSTSHFRSISLPSRLIHPSNTNIEAKINDLKVSSNLVNPTRNFQGSLVALAELYVCVDELVRSPKTQQAFSRQQNGTLVENALEGSMFLLDSCNALKELFVSMKENVQILQSTLRRKGCDHPTVAIQIDEYLCSRKKAKKSIIKSLASLKQLEKKMALFSFVNLDYHLSMVTKLLGDVYILTISIFKSLLVFMSMKTKSSKVVELVLRVLPKSAISTHDKIQTFVSEVDILDLALESLLKSVNNNETNIVDVQMIVRSLQSVNVCIEGFETGLDLTFRRLIKTRVCLLNIIAC
ncbi:uncharacterized protein [Rutidosis leptorrhynchoides]|uniref:uncharacterized protein n=1 Tax=Rutidosis leptorrhynchoides TaxID=125765 RepID=UPI003A99C23A